MDLTTKDTEEGEAEIFDTINWIYRINRPRIHSKLGPIARGAIGKRQKEGFAQVIFSRVLGGASFEICDDQLYAKILPASVELEKQCDKETPYPGAKPHYLVEEAQLRL